MHRRKGGGSYRSQIRIIFQLHSQPLSSKDLRVKTGLSKNTVHDNLAVLKELKIAQESKYGRNVIYRLTCSILSACIRVFKFHAYLGNKQCSKILKAITKISKFLSKECSKIWSQTCKFVSSYRKTYDELKKLLPEVGQLDVWEAAPILDARREIKTLRKQLEPTSVKKGRKINEYAWVDNYLWLSNVKHCPECGSNHLIYDGKRGEIVCHECGLVVDSSYSFVHHRIPVQNKANILYKPSRFITKTEFDNMRRKYWEFYGGLETLSLMSEEFRFFLMLYESALMEIAPEVVEFAEAHKVKDRKLYINDVADFERMLESRAEVIKKRISLLKSRLLKDEEIARQCAMKYKRRINM